MHWFNSYKDNSKFICGSQLFLYTTKTLVHVVSVDRDIKCDIVRTTNK